MTLSAASHRAVDPAPRGTTRRGWLLSAAAVACLPVKAHNDAGRVVPPLPAPELALTLHDGSRSTLRRLLAGHATALQLMFTGCTASCPIQGALFGAVRQRIAGQRGQRLLSISIDALADDPPALRAWLQRHGAGAGAGWLAAVPPIADVERLFDYLRARSRQPDRHTAQVYFFNANAELALRSTDFPSPEQVAALLAALPEPSRRAGVVG